MESVSGFPTSEIVLHNISNSRTGKTHNFISVIFGGIFVFRLNVANVTIWKFYGGYVSYFPGTS